MITLYSSVILSLVMMFDYFPTKESVNVLKELIFQKEKILNIRVYSENKYRLTCPGSFRFSNSDGDWSSYIEKALISGSQILVIDENLNFNLINVDAKIKEFDMWQEEDKIYLTLTMSFNAKKFKNIEVSHSIYLPYSRYQHPDQSCMDVGLSLQSFLQDFILQTYLILYEQL